MAEITLEQVLYQMLWDRRTAARWLRLLGVDHFAGRVAYGPSIAAVIDHHDRTHPEAAARGPARIASIVAHTQQLAADVRERPDHYTDAAAGLNARRLGDVDPQLLRHAAGVLTRLPAIATIGDDEQTDEQ
jgi:hypothetical protein